MIIGESFAWGHLGKTGGHTTWELFHLFPETIVFADQLGHERQHTPFAERRSQIEGKDLALNIRRLPSWMLSYQMHVARFGDYPEYHSGPMASPHEMATSDAADRHLDGFTDGGRLEIDYWLRTEHLLDDFLDFISRYVDVPSDRREQIAMLGRKNVGAYDRRLQHWFSSAHVELMYRSNPKWAAVEQKVYDDSFRDSNAAVAVRPPAPAEARLEGPGDRESLRWRTRLARKLRSAR